ncbi:hypothetical protein [Singulisphaera acidiphila]|uniref:Uncharacterized protein n=1 Tax=Singulisphaera acidiphila (strain ATCC BAA-1392 / DSM 18658 / VKM B-2454 / MOB10) TaxID=886293 RepID=L0D9W2_SINAD|nr:hypothetical protein [Singulisphaera acidiphila]AGA26032.1 hypothetical protein Sinac_1654 [Singulisphaera acidiphila DSM 18658]
MIHVTTDHCEACPVAEGLPCYRDPGTCQRVAQPGQEAFRETIARHGKILAAQAVLATQSMGGVQPVTLERVSSPTRPTVAASTVLIARIKACPHWQASSECGCGVNRCAAGKGRDGKVSHQDCFECLQEARVADDEQA